MTLPGPTLQFDDIPLRVCDVAKGDFAPIRCLENDHVPDASAASFQNGSLCSRDVVDGEVYVAKAWAVDSAGKVALEAS